MPFPKMKKPKYPPRLWGLMGYPGSGKTTFAVQMLGPLLVVDADHRFSEVLDLANGREIFLLSEKPVDNTETDRIAAILDKEMRASSIGTIVVDSLTAIITPLVVQIMIDKDAGREKNLAAGFRKKALAMRQLQDAVTKWGTDALWIYHLMDARDAQGKAIVRATVSQTELARLTRSTNLQLEIVQQGDRRGIKVVWARRGRSNITLWDEDGLWANMPEKIEAAVYDGLSQADQEQIEAQTPYVFPTPESAIDWGYQQGAFKSLEQATHHYNKIKNENRPNNAREMASLWVSEVQSRLAGNNGDQK
jgi:hypothetical protein